MTIYIKKFSQEDADWTFDWSAKGAGTDDPIESVTIGASIPSGITSHTTSHTQSTTTTWFAGGQSGLVYIVPLEVTTEAGRVYAEQLQITVS